MLNIRNIQKFKQTNRGNVLKSFDFISLSLIRNYHTDQLTKTNEKYGLGIQFYCLYYYHVICRIKSLLVKNYIITLLCYQNIICCFKMHTYVLSYRSVKCTRIFTMHTALYNILYCVDLKLHHVSFRFIYIYILSSDIRFLIPLQTPIGYIHFFVVFECVSCTH